MIEQFQLTFAASIPLAGICSVPAALGCDSVVPLTEGSLVLSDDAAPAYIRQRMSADQIRAEINDISAIGAGREAFGMHGLFSFDRAPLGYASVDSSSSCMAWLHGHELKRLHQLKLSLPSYGEECLAARERIQSRISARKLTRAHRDPVCTQDRPLAAHGLTSYRYKGRMGFVMIGAMTHEDALREAQRSTSVLVTAENLEVWDGHRYVPASNA